MAKKCPAKYKNLNLIQSFSEQGYATIQLMKQACMNDEWLRQRVDKLSYLSPPAVRKWQPIRSTVRKDGSWGYGIYNGKVNFSKSIEKSISLIFTDEEIKEYINTSRTLNKRNGIVFESYEDGGNPFTDYDYLINENTGKYMEILVDGSVQEAVDQSLASGNTYETDDVNDERHYVANRAVLPTHLDKTTKKGKYNSKTGNAWEGGQINAYWYVGFNKAKNYYVRPDWLADYKDLEIPSVCRGQTFTTTATGKLLAVDLQLGFTGDGTSNTGSPLYVEIWRVKNRVVNKTEWDDTDHYQKFVYEASEGGTTTNIDDAKKDANGNPIHIKEKVAWIDSASSRNNPLAKAEYHPDRTTGGWTTITFDKPCKVTKGHKYAIVLMSPLSEYANCPTWGGWGRNCYRDKKYEFGHAFYSENNGRTWHLYGKNDPNAPDYHAGRYIPQDFAFRCHIQTKPPVFDVDEYYDTDEHYLYFKPIFSNPITHIDIDSEDNNSESDDLHVQYEYSLTGRVYKDDVNRGWTIIPELYEIEVPRPHPTKIFIRAVMKTDDREKTPAISGVQIRLRTELPKEMYVRTYYYAPKTSPMLGANLWGRFYGQIIEEEQTRCRAEIIQSTDITDHFTLVDLEEVHELMDEVGIDTTDIVNKDRNARAIYFTDHRDILDTLKKSNIYVLPVVFKKNNDDDYETIFKLSFTPVGEPMEVLVNDETYSDTFSGLNFTNQCASPIKEVELESKTNTKQKFSEWQDYIFDYGANELIFHKETLIPHTPTDEFILSSGDLSVTYNKVFIDNLSPSQIGWHTDTETGLKEDGLILDYFKEIFTINEEHLLSRRLPLRVEPVDPIREVVLNRDTENEISLIEGIDYTLDINTNELVFSVVNEEGVYKSILNLNDIVDVVYTPFLPDEQIAIGFHAKRTNLNRQVEIDDYYLEYKV